jgi:hypothetical protein
MTKRILIVLVVLFVASPALAQVATPPTYPEDTASVSGESIVMMGVRRCDTTPSTSSSTAGDRVTFCADANGRIYVNGSLYTPAGDTAMDDTANAIKTILVDAAGTTVDTITTGSAGSASTDVLTVQGIASMTPLSAGFFDGTNIQAARVVDADTSGGTFYTQAINLVSRTSGTPAELGVTGNPLVVDAASANLDSVNGAPLSSTNPVAVRFSDGTDFVDPAIDAEHGVAVEAKGPQTVLEASSDVSANTAVEDGDAVRMAGDLIGRAIVVGPCDRSARIRSVTTVTDGSSTSAISAIASIFLEIWDVIIANTSATPVTVDLRDGTAGSVLATFPVPADTTGVVHRFAVPITSSVNTAIAVDPSAAASSIIVTLSGCKAK